MRPQNDLNDFAHLPRVDEAELAKQDLWRRAKQAEDARRATLQPAQIEPEPAPPPPSPKRKIKLRVPPGARATPQAEESQLEAESPAWESPEPEATAPDATAYEPEPPALYEVAALAEEDTETVSDEVPVELSPAPEKSQTHFIPAPAKARPKPTPLAKQAQPPEAEAPAPSKAPKENEAPVVAVPSEPAAKVDKATEPAQEAPAEDAEKDAEAAPPFIAPKSENEPEEEPEERIKRIWDKIGGRSLSLSVGIHLLLFLIAGFIYLNYTESNRIDFLPGGGTQQGEQASKALENQVTRKKTRWLNQKLPMQRIAVEKSMSEISLPEAKPELLDLPMAGDFLSAGKMGSFGFGSSGAGGGFGNGIGVGGKSGITFTPLSMFGKKIAGRRIAVVMDVSKSMTPYLEDVVKELDRVAAGSPVILYYGCGLLRAGDDKIDETVQRTQMKDFERFWRIWQGNAMLGFSGVDLKKITFPAKEKIPLEDLYRFFARRNNTWFLDYNGMDFAWTALLCQEIRNADALYWFSDFEDNVDERQMKVVLDNLLVRRQRLYIHPQTHGSSFEQVKASIVEPSGGDVVEPDDGKKKPKR